MNPFWIAVASRAVGGILIGVAALTPWAFGGSDPVAVAALHAAVLCAASLHILVVCSSPLTTTVLPTACIPLGLAVVGAVLQLASLSSSTIQAISPQAAEVYELLRPTGARTTQTLSLYPASTRHDLAQLVLALAVFWLGAQVLANRRAFGRLVTVMTLSGTALSLFGLVQELTWAGKLYWFVPADPAASPFGPFINRNNAAGFLNLCLACALARLVMPHAARVSQRAAIHSYPLLRSSIAGRTRWMLDPFADLTAGRLAALAAVIFIGAGVVCTFSRGGILSLVSGASVTICALFALRRPTFRPLTVAALAAGILAVVAWVGMTGNILARMGTLFESKAITSGRLPHWKVALQAAADYPLTGSGLGTYRYVYGHYETNASPRWFYHAENQYLEALVEGGCTGLVLLLAALALVSLAALRLMRLPDELPVALAGVFALATQSIHACFDFGLYMPANMVLMALLCGAFVGRAAQLESNRRPWLIVLPSSPRFALVVAVILVTGLSWAVREARRAGAVAQAIDQIAQQASATSTAPLDQIAEPLEKALQIRPDDAGGQQALAELWIERYRVQAYAQLRQEQGESVDAESLWKWTEPIVLHHMAYEHLKASNATDLEELSTLVPVQECLRPAVDRLLAARRACPLLPRVHLRLAELSFLLGNPGRDLDHLAGARWLTPGNPEVLYECGKLDFSGGRKTEAYAEWRACLSRDELRTDSVLGILAGELTVPELLDLVLPRSPKLLARLAQERYQGPDHAEDRRALLEHSQR